MVSDFQLALRVAEDAATKVIEGMGISTPEEIDVRQIAEQWFQAIVLEDYLGGAIARMVKNGTKVVIKISNRHSSKQQGRFSLAHELGHLALDHNEGLFDACSEDDMHDWGGLRINEVQANAFAAGLLMPELMVRPYCETETVDFSRVVNIAKKFDVSLTSAAIRFVKLNSECCAVVFAQRETVRWVYTSSDFRFRITKGKAIHPQTLASDFFEDGREWSMPTGVPLDAWVDSDTRSSGTEIIEHTKAFPNFNSTLSLLWLKNA